MFYLSLRAVIQNEVAILRNKISALSIEMHKNEL